MTKHAILETHALGFPWTTADPFLFCVYHQDAYPAGNAQMGPATSLQGRRIGMDFAGKDGWRMYHGDVVPGFPQHPHRGFETITIAREGVIDHADSLGATARFGQGDVQWMTAGGGVVHSEMFPLRDQDGPNPLELFQIWLNLPRSKKQVEPYFTMLWSHTIPSFAVEDEAGLVAQVAVVAGSFGAHKAPPPPPDSWASEADTEVAIWTLKLAPGASFVLPPAAAGLNRSLFFFHGDSIEIAGQGFDQHAGISLRSDAEVLLQNGNVASELLLLQGRPINEPVAQHGPFVMNSADEIQQTFEDYRRTGFGGWPWPSDAPVHPRERGRFAQHADGRVEEAPEHTRKKSS